MGDFVIVVLVVVASLCSGQSVVVETDCGPLQGEIDNNRIINFLGIRYGVPPVGELRWKRPLDLKDNNKCWNGVYPATQYGSQCVQYDIVSGILDGNEDCLFLNIWRTESNFSQPLPVMVFIHGGSLVGGSGATVGMNPYFLAKDGIVSVSFNYRLSVFGFLALKELSDADEFKISGNYGFFDQILALTWIKKNIRNFGGDPNSVTIWGQSSGGTSVMALLVSPLAKGLFHKAISMSGSPRNGVPLVDLQEIMSKYYIPNTQCNGLEGDALLTCLYSLSSTEALKATNELWNPAWLFGIPNLNDTLIPFAAIDNYLFMKDFSSSFERGEFSKVPIIFGNMHDEVDMQPVDVVISWPQDTYIGFLDKKFSAWNIPNFVQQLLSLYPTSNFLSQQQHYDSICADFHSICGNIEIIVNIAKHQDFNTYYYVSDQYPAVRQCLYDPPSYCPRYSFHCLDLFAMIEFLVPTLQSDLIFGKKTRSIFIEFATYGSVKSYKEWVPVIGNDPNRYNVILHSNNGSIRVDYKKDVCQFWKKNGFDLYQWQN